MFITPEAYLARVATDQAKLQKAALDYAELVKQYDALAGKIVAELSQAENDLDTLMALENLAFREGKENSQRITSFLGFTITGNIATTKMHVRDAWQSIKAKG